MTTTLTSGSPRFFGASARTLGALLSPAGARARLAVFSYHQVLEAKDPLRPGEPDRAEFAKDVEVITRVFSVLPLAEAARRLAEGTLPSRAACITFDDGYANNYELAAPILEAAGAPATFFVAGGAVDAGIMWNDLVIEAVAAVRGPLVLDALGLDGLDGLDGLERARRILARLKYEPLESRWAAAMRFFRDNAAADPPRLMMTRETVAALGKRGFDIGAHTINHPILKTMSDEGAREEIRGSRDWVHAVTGRRPECFAYPNGKPGTDFGPEHARMVEEAGYEVAVTTEWGLGRTGTDSYRLPRVGPWWRQGRTVPAGLLRIYARSWVTRYPS